MHFTLIFDFKAFEHITGYLGADRLLCRRGGRWKWWRGKIFVKHSKIGGQFLVCHSEKGELKLNATNAFFKGMRIIYCARDNCPKGNVLLGLHAVLIGPSALYINEHEFTYFSHFTIWTTTHLPTYPPVYARFRTCAGGAAIMIACV